MTIRPLLFFSAIIAFGGCAAWEPDYEPDPDARLAELVDALAADPDRSTSAATPQQLRVEVERLATRHPSHVASQVAAAALALESGQRVTAQNFLERALDIEPGHIEARSMRVQIAVADGSMDLARKLVVDGLRLRPDAGALYESSAWLYQIEGATEASLADLDAAERLGAPRWRVEFHRGLLLEQSGDFDGAREHYRAAADTDEGCLQAEQRLAGLEARRPDGGD